MGARPGGLAIARVRWGETVFSFEDGGRRGISSLPYLGREGERYSTRRIYRDQTSISCENQREKRGTFAANIKMSPSKGSL